MSASMSAARVSNACHVDATARAPLTSDRPKSPAFETLWPKGARPRRAPAQAAAPAEVPVIPPESPRRRSKNTAPSRCLRSRSRKRRTVRFSNPALSTAWPTRCIPTAPSRRDCPKARCASARSPNCAITSSKRRGSDHQIYKGRRRHGYACCGSVLLLLLQRHNISQDYVGSFTLYHMKCSFRML